MKEKTSELDLATLIIPSSSTLQESGAQYKFVARCQNADHAILPIHTKEEKIMFNWLLTHRFPDHLAKPIDFKMFTRIWSPYVDGKNIFYKAPEHLKAHYNTWKQIENIIVTIGANADVVHSAGKDVTSSSRNRVIPEAEQPKALELPLFENDLQTTRVDSVSERSVVRPLRPAPPSMPSMRPMYPVRPIYPVPPMYPLPSIPYMYHQPYMLPMSSMPPRPLKPNNIPLPRQILPKKK